jgi:hypothetical protein
MGKVEEEVRILRLRTGVSTMRLSIGAFIIPCIAPRVWRWPWADRAAYVVDANGNGA